MQYSHRNGETEVPRILGAYWFEDSDGLRVVTPDKILENNPGEYAAWVGREPIPDGQGRWWGPIPKPVTPPWEQDA